MFYQYSLQSEFLMHIRRRKFYLSFYLQRFTGITFARIIFAPLHGKNAYLIFYFV